MGDRLPSGPDLEVITLTPQKGNGHAISASF